MSHTHQAADKWLSKTKVDKKENGEIMPGDYIWLFSFVFLHICNAMMIADDAVQGAMTNSIITVIPDICQ